MLKVVSALMLAAALLLFGLSALAQAPTGIINGTITDETGAVIPNASVTATNKATGITRTATSNAEGLYSMISLPAGDYEVRCEAKGFRTLVRGATVAVGQTTQVALPMSIGGTQEVVTVEAATAQINYDNNQVQGVIQRGTIQELPLNGRSFIQLAQLEPGVTISTGTPAQFNALFTVSVMGSGNRTVYTVDGGNVSDNIDVGGGITSMNFSQEVIQEFQLSQLNFDLATPISDGGALNIVTRSGSNDFHGSALYFFRDHNMAAYPNLQRSALNPSPFFVRRNPGAWLGGPVIKDKLFFFFDYEYTNQVQALAIQTTTPSFIPLEGTYGSPYSSKTLTFRMDYHLNDKNSIFLRYSHDGNLGFGQALIGGDPSSWARNTNWADQSIIGLTTTITPNIVNDLRFQYNYWGNHNNQAVPSDCSLPCVAGSLPTIYTFVGANYPAVGPNFNAPQGRNTRRYETSDALSWQKGTHRLKIGGDMNPTYSAGLWGFCTPMCVGAYAPEFVRSTFGAAAALLFPTLPTILHTDADALNLPVYLGASSIFSGVGVGSIQTPAPYGRTSQEGFNQYRAYLQDTWKIRPNLTVNYGLAWNAQVGFYNSNLSKPAYLAPILGTGPNNLGPTVNNTREFQPAFGFAWSPFKDNKTVIRGGGGIYWDGTPGYYKLREPPVIGPLGDGRSTLAGSAFTNIFPGIYSNGVPLPVGANLPLSTVMNLTVAQFQQIVAQQLPAIQAKLAPANPQTSGPYTVSGINVAKQGVEIYPTHFPLARSYDSSLGIQRDMGHGMVLTADWARRQAENYSLGEVDYNKFNQYTNGARTPVIPLCTPAQAQDVTAECSTGSMTFWTDQGRSIYEGMLVKLNKRMEHHFQFTASYALQRETAETAWNLNNWMAGYGQILPHHNLNVAGVVQLPWGFSLSINSAIVSRTPVMANVSSLELPGTVNSGSTEPLPGLAYNSLNAGNGKAQLAAAVAAFDANIAGTKNANGSTIAPVALPQNYALSQPFFSQDFRLSKVFTVKERYRFTILAEMFNAFNISNVTIGSYSLDPLAAGSVQTNGILTTSGPTQATNFGQPTGRVAQTFGSGGPRAVQVGARFQF